MIERGKKKPKQQQQQNSLGFPAKPPKFLGQTLTPPPTKKNPKLLLYKRNAKNSQTRTLLQRHWLSLALRFDRENEEAINSTRNSIYSLKVFTSYFIDVDTFYLFLNWFSTRVSDDRKYVCGRRLYACINTRKFKGLDSRQITSLPEIKKVIYMARLINHRRK